MKQFLMCEPKFFEVCYVINPWMEGNQGKVDKSLAQKQWQNLYDAVTKLATVSLIDPIAGLPDMVFTANAGLPHQGEVIVSSFLHPERQPEADYFERYFSAHNFRVHHMKQGTVFEGAGDALFDASGRLWFSSGFRSDAHALEEVNNVFDVEIHALQLVDPHWYHLDTCFCPLPDGQAIAYAQAFSADSMAVLDEEFEDRIVWVSEEDARNFACNAVAIGRNIILHQATLELKFALEKRGFEVIETDVSEFLKAGGACKCMVLEI